MTENNSTYCGRNGGLFVAYLEKLKRVEPKCTDLSKIDVSSHRNAQYVQYRDQLNARCVTGNINRYADGTAPPPTHRFGTTTLKGKTGTTPQGTGADSLANCALDDAVRLLYLSVFCRRQALRKRSSLKSHTLINISESRCQNKKHHFVN